jgi:hypothetical protein
MESVAPPIQAEPAHIPNSFSSHFSVIPTLYGMVDVGLGESGAADRDEYELVTECRDLAKRVVRSSGLVGQSSVNTSLSC